MTNFAKVFSAMRPTGRLHLGHLHGVIKNWIKLQYEYECYFMVADIQALTVCYQDSKQIEELSFLMVVDWLACGVDPSQSVIFLQSQVPQHAEIHLLLSMITPLSWLERFPAYRDILENSQLRDLDTYGLLGYALLQASDILLYNAKYVPIGEDQIYHVELAREIARRFNYLYGREKGFELKAQNAIKKLGIKKSLLYQELLVRYQQEGDELALEEARFLLQDAVNLMHGERDRLFAFLENKAKVILTEPQHLLSENAKIPGIDGQKMAKFCSTNSIILRENPAVLDKKIMEMQTDSARIKRIDPGDPDKCPVWQLHKIYSNDEVRQWVQTGCTQASIGCVDCKKNLIEMVKDEQAILHERAKPYLDDRSIINNILANGSQQATDHAMLTLKAIKQAMKIVQG